MNKTKNIIYPRCYKTFTKWCETDYSRKHIFNCIGMPKPFDVTLRDGLQTLSKEEQPHFNLSKKIELYNFIRRTHRPKNMEIGSIVSDKVLPIFKDSIDFYKYCQLTHNGIVHNYKEYQNDKFTDHKHFSVVNNWLLIPNETNYEKTVSESICPNMSFITSVSESFQQKNTRMSLSESITNISNILLRVEDSNYNCRPLTKIYVSCINECPIDGKVSLDKIVEHIVTLSTLKPDTICLSDTCGTMTVDEFDSLIRRLIINNVPLSRISLHLHVSNEEITEQIIWKALDYGIINFDVSMLDTGGCSVTMKKTKISPNLSYDLYYKSFVNWIIKKINV